MERFACRGNNSHYNIFKGKILYLTERKDARKICTHPGAILYPQFDGTKGGGAIHEKKITALLVEPGQKPRKVETDVDIQTLSRLVDGRVGVTYPVPDMKIFAVYNEEGKWEGQPPNRWIQDPATGQAWDLMAGTFLLCTSDEEGELASLTEEQLRQYGEELDQLMPPA